MESETTLGKERGKWEGKVRGTWAILRDTESWESRAYETEWLNDFSRAGVNILPVAGGLRVADSSGIALSTT